MAEDAKIMQIIEVRRDMFLRGLVSSHAETSASGKVRGCTSRRKGHPTSRLSAADIVQVDLERSDDPAALLLLVENPRHPPPRPASPTGAGAIVHAHPPYLADSFFP